MKKLIILVIVGFALLAGYRIAEGFIDAMLKDKRSRSSQLSLAEIAKLANATLPKQIDNNTRLDREIAGPGNRMTYQYTLLNLAVADIDTAALTARLKPELIKAYRTMPELARYRARQVELQYEYRDKDGQHVTAILVSPKDL
ncbi:MAG TPA: hypothetical protein VEC99_11855 [Clostridia bacterium]|nr:hypothetical protein [Clostridia bacterium]